MPTKPPPERQTKPTQRRKPVDLGKTKKFGPLLIINFPRGTRWPNMHEVAFTVFAYLTWVVLRQIENNPNLLAVPSYMQFCQTLVTGGILAAAAWLWSSNKAKDKAEEAQSHQPHQTQDMDVHVEGDVNMERKP